MDYLDILIKLGYDNEKLTYELQDFFKEEGSEHSIYSLDPKMERTGIDKFFVDLSKFYYEKIFLEGFVLSAEDIIRYLDISVSYSLNILSRLEYIELPINTLFVKRVVKRCIKQHIAPPNVLGYTLFGSTYTNLMRKKKLYSLSSFEKFLTEHTYYETKEDIFLTIYIDEEMQEHLEVNEIEKILNKFSSQYQTYQKIKLSTLVDINKDLKRFAIPVDINIINENKSSIKSASSLSTIYNYVYPVETIRRIEKTKDVTPFYLDYSNSKLPLKRYIMKDSILLTEFQNGLKGAYISDTEPNLKKQQIKLGTKIKRYLFITEFNNSETLFRETFKKHLEKYFKKNGV